MVEAWTSELVQWLREEAAKAGFDAAGVASVPPPDDPSARLSARRFADWVDGGRAGEMEYLKRRDGEGVLLRSGVQVAMPWARSVVVCAMNYNAAAPRSIDPAPDSTGWIARYAWSGTKAGDSSRLLPSDYHDELLHRLRRIEQALKERFSCETRCYVDTGPLVERTVAQQAGIGWIGKNTCIINQELGSWLMLAVIVTSVPIGGNESLQIAADRCGSCTRCIDACPTDALVEPRQMDASRCIAYLTIEKKGSIPEDIREAMGRQVFGCDICQDVCPWNRRAPITPREGMLTRMELINPSLNWLASLDGPDFRRHFKGSPLERTGLKRLRRNVAIAMANCDEEDFLPQLEHWTETEDPVLAETAEWAVRRYRGRMGPPSDP